MHCKQHTSKHVSIQVCWISGAVVYLFEPCFTLRADFSRFVFWVPAHFYPGWTLPAEQSGRYFSYTWGSQGAGHKSGQKGHRRPEAGLPVHPLPQSPPRWSPLWMGWAENFLDQCRGFPLKSDCRSLCQLHPNSKKIDWQEENINFFFSLCCVIHQW